MNIDEKKLEDLMRENKLDEAREYIRQSILAPLSDVERGEAIVLVTTAYMKLMNGINEEYRDSLQDILDELRSVDKMKEEVDQEIELKKVRIELA